MEIIRWLKRDLLFGKLNLSIDEKATFIVLDKATRKGKNLDMELLERYVLDYAFKYRALEEYKAELYVNQLLVNYTYREGMLKRLKEEILPLLNNYSLLDLIRFKEKLQVKTYQ